MILLWCYNPVSMPDIKLAFMGFMKVRTLTDYLATNIHMSQRRGRSGTAQSVSASLRRDRQGTVVLVVRYSCFVAWHINLTVTPAKKVDKNQFSIA